MSFFGFNSSSNNKQSAASSSLVGNILARVTGDVSMQQQQQKVPSSSSAAATTTTASGASPIGGAPATTSAGGGGICVKNKDGSWSVTLERAHINQPLDDLGVCLSDDCEITGIRDGTPAAAGRVPPQSAVIVAVNGQFVSTKGEYEAIAKKLLNVHLQIYDSSALEELLAAYLDRKPDDAELDFKTLHDTVPRYCFLSLEHPLYMHWVNKLERAKETVSALSELDFLFTAEIEEKKKQEEEDRKKTVSNALDLLKQLDEEEDEDEEENDGEGEEEAKTIQKEGNKDEEKQHDADAVAKVAGLFAENHNGNNNSAAKPEDHQKAPEVPKQDDRAGELTAEKPSADKNANNSNNADDDDYLNQLVFGAEIPTVAAAATGDVQIVSIAKLSSRTVDDVLIYDRCGPIPSPPDDAPRSPSVHSENQDLDDAVAPIIDNSMVCRDFLHGKCDRAGRCPYVHIDQPNSSGASPSNSTSGFSASTWRQHYASSQLCRTYERTGACRRGDQCPYSHVPPSQQQQQQAQGRGEKTNKKQEICRNYQRNRCTRGDACHYIHEDTNRAVPERRERTSGRTSDYHHHHHHQDDDEDNNNYSKRRRKDSDGSSKKRDICYDYLKGECRSGADCKYAHGPRASSSWQDNSGAGGGGGDRRDSRQYRRSSRSRTPPRGHYRR